MTGNPRRWSSPDLILLGLLAATLLVRFVALEIDPPYAVIRSGGAFLTDEGWYSKSSQTLTRYGEWSSEHDIAWFSHNPLFTALQVGVFKAFGISLVVARCVSTVSFLLSIAAFYALVRSVMPRDLALVACLLVSVTIHAFAYSRVAFVEPVGVMLCVTAMALWVRRPESYSGAAGSMLLGAAAIFVKISFVYALVAVTLLNLGDAFVAWRGGRRTKAAVIGGVTIAVDVGAVWLHRWIVAWAAIDGAKFEKWHVTGRLESLKRVGDVLLSELKACYNIAFEIGMAFLVCATVVGLLVALRRSREWRIADVPRATLAMSLWLLGGVSFFGLFWEQAPRYLYFALFPVAYGAVLVARAVLGNERWRPAALFLLLVHAGLQVPAYTIWLRSRPLTSARDTAVDVVRRLPADDVVLMGGLSGYVGLFHPRLRPLAFWQLPMAERVALWRPQYLLTGESNPGPGRLLEKCPDLVDRIEIVASYEVLGGVRPEGSRQVLVRIHYKE